VIIRLYSSVDRHDFLVEVTREEYDLLKRCERRYGYTRSDSPDEQALIEEIVNRPSIKDPIPQICYYE